MLAVDFEISEPRLLHGDIAFLQATITNRGKNRAIWNEFRPSDALRMQVSSKQRLAGPPLVVGEYVDPLNAVKWPSLQIEPEDQYDVIVMIRITLGPEPDPPLGLETITTVNYRFAYNQYKSGVSGLVTGRMMRLNCDGDLRKPGNSASFYELVNRIHGYQFNVESQQATLSDSEGLLSDSRFPVANLEGWQLSRDRINEQSTLSRVLDLSDKANSLVANHEGAELGSHLFYLTSKCPSPIEQKWVIRKLYRHIASKDATAAARLKIMAIEGETWDCVVH